MTLYFPLYLDVTLTVLIQAYHQKVIEQEDLSLVEAEFLWLVGIWDLKQSTVAH